MQLQLKINRWTPNAQATTSTGRTEGEAKMSTQVCIFIILQVGRRIENTPDHRRKYEGIDDTHKFYR